MCDLRPQELRQRQHFDAARRHRGVFDDLLAERRDQPLADADQAGRRKHDEGDEHQAEPEQPVLGVDAEEFAEQDEEQRARAPAPGNCACRRSRPSPADRRRTTTEIGSAEVMRFWNSRRMPARPVIAGRQHEGDQLVAVGRIAEEARALLVLADRDQHACRRSNYGSATAGSAPGRRCRNEPVIDRSRIPD